MTYAGLSAASRKRSFEFSDGEVGVLVSVQNSESLFQNSFILGFRFFLFPVLNLLVNAYLSLIMHFNSDGGGVEYCLRWRVVSVKTLQSHFAIV